MYVEAIPLFWCTLKYSWMKEEQVGRKCWGGGKTLYFIVAVRVRVISVVLPNIKKPCGSEGKCINPRSHSYTIHTGHRTVGMEHKT
jgi:hypothetical protein